MSANSASGARTVGSGSQRGLRCWVTPVTIGAFLLIGVTGVLMFFKVRGGLIVVVHEWLSLVLVIAAVLHTALNWGAVRAHLSRARGAVIVGLFGVLLVLCLLPLEPVTAIAREHGHGQEDLGRRAAELLLGDRIATVAELTGRTPEALRERLARDGVVIAADDLTLADAARRSHVHPAHLLDAALRDGTD